MNARSAISAPFGAYRERMRDSLAPQHASPRRSNELPRPTSAPLPEYPRALGRPTPLCEESSAGPNTSIYQPPLTIALGEFGIDLNPCFFPGFRQRLLA